MILRLVWRSLVRRPGRSALLLAGYALGVGVTVALLSIGSALLEQARDRELVGGGDLAVLPAGIDLETLKTGGVSSLYFSIEQAPFLYRQVLAGPRFDDRIEAAAPWIDDELVYLEAGGRIHAVSAGGRIPGLARELGVRPEVVAGMWRDGPSDRRWRSPGDSALYAGMDRFHLPAGAAAGDTAWAEWHYFNVRLPGGGGAGAGGWLYLTYMVAGAVPDGRWGGRLLATLVTPEADGRDPGPERRERTWEARVPAGQVAFSLLRPDLEIGDAAVALDSGGVYRLRARIPPSRGGASARPSGRAPRAGPRSGAPGDGGDVLRVELTVRAATRQHLPPLEVSSGAFPSGYTAPILDGRATGRICAGDGCRELEAVPAYHDHNWGVWRAVTWDWGQARAGAYSVLYGGVRRDPAAGAQHPAAGARDAGGGRAGRLLFLSDTLGFLGLFSIDSLTHRWARPEISGRSRAATRPTGLALRASRGADSVALDAEVRHARTTGRPGTRALFHQMEGTARLRARLRGDEVRASGRGFFETWRPAAADGAGPGAPGGASSDGRSGLPAGFRIVPGAAPFP